MASIDKTHTLRLTIQSEIARIHPDQLMLSDSAVSFHTVQQAEILVSFNQLKLLQLQ